MIPVVSSDRDQPTDDGRFQLTIEHSIALGMQFQSDCQNCIATPLRDIKPGNVIRVYYKSSAILDKDVTKYVHYTVGSFIQNDERMLKIMDMTMVSPTTPERGMIHLDQIVYHELKMHCKLSGPAPQVVIPNTKEAPVATKDGMTMPMNAQMKRRQM